MGKSDSLHVNIKLEIHTSKSYNATHVTGMVESDNTLLASSSDELSAVKVSSTSSQSSFSEH